MLSRKILALAIWIIGTGTTLSFQLGYIGPHRCISNGYRLPLRWSSLDTSSTTENNDNDVIDEAVGAWIPIASVSSLRGLGPQRVTVMGLDLVVWEDSTNTNSWAVQTDACPHRLAPLSQGRVDSETNCIECPYHGWQFDKNGTLTRIPQLEKEKRVDSWKNAGKLTSFPVHLAGDALYAFLPSSVHGEMFSQSVLPEHSYPSLRDAMSRNLTYYVRDLPYSFDFLVENFMDPAHIPFAHHSLQSLRSDGMEIPMEVLVSNFTHLEMSFKDQVRGKKREGIVSFQRPTMYHFRILNKETGIYIVNLNIHVVPVRAGWSRILLSSPLSNSLPRWLGHGFSNRFLNSDSWLHDAEIVARSRSKNNENYVFASNSDAGTRTFRRWWRNHGLSMAPPNTFGPSSRSDLKQLSRREQIDAWEMHAKHCVSCRKALTNVKKLEKGGFVVAIASAILLRPWPVRALLLAATSLYTTFLCTKIATAIEGNPHRSGYSDRSAAHQHQEKDRDNNYLSKLLVMLARLRSKKKKPSV